MPRTYAERYYADEVCVEGHDKLPGKPCQECAEHVPPVLRPPPFSRCVEDPVPVELPENAGRHKAPDSIDETRDTMEYLRDLRGAAGTPRRAC